MARETSALWKELFRAGARREYAFEIDGVWYGGEAEIGHSVDSGLYEEFGIGNAASAKLTLDILAQEIPRGAVIKRYARLVNGERASEWLAAGVFFANKRSEDAGRWRIEAFDGLRKADAVWEPEEELAFPMDMGTAADVLARAMGCELDERTALKESYTVDYPANGYTIRDVLGFIAAAQGGNWVMTGEGRLRLVPLRGTGERHEIGLDLTDFQDKGAKKPVSRVTLGVDEGNVITAGDDTGLELTASCPYATQAMATALLRSLQGYEYRMYEAEAVNIDPAAELGDLVTVAGIPSVLARMADDGGGYPSISAPGEAELEEEFPAAGPLAQTLERKIAETRSAITKTAEEIRLEVEATDGRVSSLTQTVDGFEQRISDAEGNVSTLTQSATILESKIASTDGRVTALTQTVDGIRGSVEGLDGSVSAVEHTANKINWLVKSGTSASDFTLTDRAIRLVAETIDLSGFVTFSDLSTEGQTTINGANLLTGSITADKINVTDLKALNARIGNFTIGANALYNGLSSLNGTANGVYVGTDGMALGGGKFKVTSAGALTASSGTVGGWTISETKIYGGDAKEGVAVMAYPRDDNTYVFAVGGNSPDGPFNDWPFRVSKEGRLSAKDARFDGNVFLANDTRLRWGDSDDTATTVIYLSANDRIHVGNAGYPLSFHGSNFSFDGNVFSPRVFAVADDGDQVWIGWGAGGDNHGLYSGKHDKWMIYADGDGNVTLNGTASGNLPLTGGTLTGTVYFANGTTYYVNSDGRAKFNGVYFGADNTYYFSYAGNIVCNSLTAGAATLSGNLTLNEDNHFYIRRSYGSGVRQDEPLRLYAGDANGSALVMQAGGLTILGGGEAGTNLYSALITEGVSPSGERLYLASDNSIYLVTNCNTVANRVTVTIGTNGTITTPGGLSVAEASAFTGSATFNGNVKAAKFIQVGSVSITPTGANMPTSAEVTFPTEFPGTPKVFVNVSTTAPGTTILGAAATGASSKGCTIWLTRANTTATTVWWMAVYT